MNWYKIKNFNPAGKTADVYIYDDIGKWTDCAGNESGVSANDFRLEVLGLGAVDEITVHIASNGGDVGEGLAIYNFLLNHPAKIITRAESICASMASVIFMAGDVRQICDTGTLMLHKCWTFTAGNADELRERADELDTIGESIKRAYMRGGITEEKVNELLAGRGSWITPEDAVEMGLATEITEGLKAVASVSMDKETVPEQYHALLKKEKEALEKETETETETETEQTEAPEEQTETEQPDETDEKQEDINKQYTDTPLDAPKVAFIEDQIAKGELSESDLSESDLTKKNLTKTVNNFEKELVMDYAAIMAQGGELADTILNRIDTAYDEGKTQAITEAQDKIKNEYQAKIDTLTNEYQAKIETLETVNQEQTKELEQAVNSIEDLTGKLSDLTAGAELNLDSKIETFADAKEKFGYVYARQHYPELYSDYAKKVNGK